MEQGIALASLHQSLHRSEEIAEIQRRAEALMPNGGDRDEFVSAWCWLVGYAKGSARIGDEALLDAMEQAMRGVR